MKIGLSVTVLSISAAAVVSDISVAVARPSYIEAEVNAATIIFSSAARPLVLPQTNLPSESVFPTDSPDGVSLVDTNLQKAVDTFKDEAASPVDSDPIFDADKILADSVTVVETRVKVFTGLIDFDPSDPDVDPDPVNVAEDDVKDITVGELADNDLAGSPGLIGFTAYGDAQLSTAVKKYGTASLKLDGTGDYVLSDDTLDYGSNPFTVEMWAYPTSGTQDDVIFDSRVAYNDDNIMLRQSGSFLVAIRGNGILKTQNNVFSANTWTHLAVTRGGTFGNTYTIFVDGAVIHTATSGGTPAAAELRIGADFNNLNGWAGYVDGFALSTSDKYGGQGFTPASPVAVDPTNPIVLAFDGANGSTTIDNTGIPETVDVYVTESIANELDIPKTDAVTTAEAIDDFDIDKAVSDTATASEAIDRFDVATAFGDTVSVTEALENEVTLPVADSVTAVQSNIKTFTSNVDFDLSDADVDPDPVTAADAISEFDFNKGLTDAATATEADAKEVTVGELADSDTASLSDSDAKEFTHGGFSDALTAVEGIKNNPEIVKSDSVTTSEAQVFDARPELSDSATLAEAIDNFDVDLVKADAVNVSDVSVKNFTENVDFDRSDADADADPVTVTETLGFDATHPLSDSFSPSEAHVFTLTNVYTDTATATESINTLLTLGDSEFVYPDFVSVSDGYRRFIEEPYSYTISSTDYFVPLTGVIGAAETINTVMLAANRVTVPDTSSAGLLVNFHYTDVDEDDRALGGYYFNQTPINAGNSTVGARTIL
jgi:hypothetical protein